MSLHCSSVICNISVLCETVSIFVYPYFAKQAIVMITAHIKMKHPKLSHSSKIMSWIWQPRVHRGYEDYLSGIWQLRTLCLERELN